MNQIEIFNETEEMIPELDTIMKLLTYATDVEKQENISFSVIIVDNKKIHEINKNFRGVDRPTDVISFALEDDDVFPDMVMDT